MNDKAIKIVEYASDFLENSTRAFIYAVFTKGENICTKGRKYTEEQARLKRNANTFKT